MNSLPMMTVAIVSHNNQATIEDAVDSVLSQTYPKIEILIVDDCSDDGTREILDQFATRTASVRVLSTLVNSGSAGAPRNLAISSATGDYITFLDGDDVLDRNAIYNFASNVKRYDIDIVTGHMIRKQVSNGSEAGWHKWLFNEAKTLESANEFPDLVYDSTSTNKAYSIPFLRENSLAFPEGVYFEDNQFSAKAYAVASGIRVIPDPVYYWLVYPAEQRLTVTANWKNTDSYSDRIEAFFVGYHAFGRAKQFDIQAKLVEKTIKHDIWLFIDAAFSASDYSTLVKLWSYAQPVFQTADSKILENIPLKPRAKIATLLAGDLQAHNEARALTSEPSKLRGSIQQGLWVPSTWSLAQALRPELAPYLSVARDQLGGISIRTAPWQHDVAKIQKSRSTVTVVGTTEDKFDHFDKKRPVEVTLRVQRHGGYLVQPVAGRFVRWNGAVCEWEVTVGKLDDQSWLRDTSWNMELGLSQGDISVVSPLRTKTKIQPITFVPEGAGLLSKVRDQLSVLTGSGGELTLRRRSRESFAGLPGKTLSTVERFRLKVLDKTLGRLDKDQRVKVVSRINRRLPIKKDLVVFESHMGKQYSDSPRAISKALSETRPDIRQLWSFENSSYDNSYAGSAVVRHSPAYVAALSRAVAVVDNQGFPSYFRRRSEQLYFQTWHGVPMKAMGTDASGKDQHEIEALKRSVSNWSITVNPNAYYADRLIRPMLYTGPTLDTGLPRNDVLIDSSAVTEFEYRELGLRAQRRYVLWAPTFREKGSEPPEKLVNWRELIDGLPDDVDILLRPHYLSNFNVPGSVRARVKDVGCVQEVSKLYRIADVLVTDYSSVIFDFMTTDKPVVLFVPDYEDYSVRQRGLNFDIKAEAPGPFVTAAGELSLAIESQLGSFPDAKYRAFKQKYVGESNGRAAMDSASYISDWITGVK